MHNKKLEGLYVHKTESDEKDTSMCGVALSMSDVEFQACVLVTKPKYIVTCEWSHDVWLVSNDRELDEKFVYRMDLKIVSVEYDNRITNHDEAISAYREIRDVTVKNHRYKKACYILDCPPAEQYEVYDDPMYVLRMYDVPIPKGMSVFKFKTRFERDKKILELEEKYKGVGKAFVSKQNWSSMGVDSAVIVSDGCYKDGCCASTYYYIDKYSTDKECTTFVPSVNKHGILIAELTAITWALYKCKSKYKKHIKCYYDNTNIVDLLNTENLENVREVSKYRNLVRSMRAEGVTINFYEIHPKTGDVSEYNRALIYLHNMCDRECKSLVCLRARPYTAVATK